MARVLRVEDIVTQTKDRSDHDKNYGLLKMFDLQRERCVFHSTENDLLISKLASEKNTHKSLFVLYMRYCGIDKGSTISDDTRNILVSRIDLTLVNIQVLLTQLKMKLLSSDKSFELMLGFCDLILESQDHRYYSPATFDMVKIVRENILERKKSYHKTIADTEYFCDTACKLI